MNQFKNIFILFFILLPFSSKSQADSMEQKAGLLKEVIVQKTGAFKNALQKAPSVDLQMSTDQFLNKIPGVTQIKRGNYAWEPSIRGLNSNQISTTIDGMPVFGACTDKMDPASSYIEPNNLQSITVSFGANDMSYGSSIGGGFNFKIKQPELNAKNKWSGLIGGGFNTNGDGLQTLAGVNFSASKFAVNMNGIFRQSGNYTAGGGEKILFSQYKKWNGSTGIKIQVAKNHQLNFNYIQDEGFDIGYPSLLMDVQYAKAKIASISHIYSGSGHLRNLETKFFFNSIDHAMDDTKRPKESVAIHMDMPGTSFTFGFFSNAEINYGKHKLKVKLNGYQNQLHAEMTMYPESGAPMYMLTLPDAQRQVAGLDISDQLTNGHISFLFGGRMDYNKSSLFSAEGKRFFSSVVSGDVERKSLINTMYINPSIHLNNQLRIFGGLSRTMRAPSLQELYAIYLYNKLDGYDYIGNPFLKNESSWNINSGINFKKNNLKIEAQVFGYFIDHYIAGNIKSAYSVMTKGANGVKQYVNLTAASIKGIELSTEIKINADIKLSSTNTYTLGSDNEKRALPLISPFKSINRISYQFKNYFLELEGIVSAKQNRVNKEFYGEEITPGYALFNFSVARNFIIESHTFSINIGIENILDSKYYDHLTISKIPSVGRNFFLHLTYKL